MSMYYTLNFDSRQPEGQIPKWHIHIRTHDSKSYEINLEAKTMASP